MRKFKYDDGTDGVGYDTLDELLQTELVWIKEYDGHYYVSPKPRSYWDQTIYKVDKKTRKAEYNDYITLTIVNGIDWDKAIPIDPETLKRVS